MAQHNTSTTTTPPPTTSLSSSSLSSSMVVVTASSPLRSSFRQPPYFSVDTISSYERYLSDRRKSFRFRGDFGSTVASAPSFEHEEYRCTRPSINNVKSGKSFDLTNTVIASTPINDRNSSSNALYKVSVDYFSSSCHLQVSADYIRINGNRQQFRNLLSARRKHESMPVAYTQIDQTASRESLYDNHQLSSSSTTGHPIITVEDATSTSSQHRINIDDDVTVPSKILSSIVVEDHNSCALPLLIDPATHSILARNNSSRYAIPIDSQAVKQIYKIRAKRVDNRVHIVNRMLTFALIGILIMIIEAELTAQRLYTKTHILSQSLRATILISTIILLFNCVLYHINEVRLDLIDYGADNLTVVLTNNRIYQLIIELVICSICPLPGTGSISWSFMLSGNSNNSSSSCSSSNGYHLTANVPIDVILSLLMFLRIYLLARFVVLHSKQFQDASTRTLAILNRIQVDFSFVMKTILDHDPLRLLIAFTLSFWLMTSWCFAQCERYGLVDQSDQSAQNTQLLYLNSMWFIAITFMLNGYGDIVPHTHCGRVVAILVGLVGATISSILIAVISRKILLSQGQRNVNNFMQDSRLSTEHKHAAARVLQQTWRIHQSRRTNAYRLRHHQRRFLDAIHRFRHVKNEMRSFNELNTSSHMQLARLMNEMHTVMQRIALSHEEMRAQIEVLHRMMRNGHYGDTTTTAAATNRLSS